MDSSEYQDKAKAEDDPPVVASPLSPDDFVVVQSSEANPYRPSGLTDPLTDSQWTASSVVLMTTLMLVGSGVFLLAPGLGILLAIIALPALLRTIVVVQVRRSRSGALSAVEQFLLFLGSFGTALVVSVVVVVSSIGTFCFVCLSAGTETAIPVAAIVAMGTTSLVMVPIGLWIRARWRRDTRG